ncbi:MAG: hypothetical protein ACOC6P_01255 [Candidatus Aminicenantaceae bacterium]
MPNNYDDTEQLFSRRIGMEDFLKINAISEKEKKKIIEQIEKRIADKKKQGILKEKDIKEIEEMRLRPLPDILDVQSVYEDFMYKKKS